MTFYKITQKFMKTKDNTQNGSKPVGGAAAQMKLFKFLLYNAI